MAKEDQLGDARSEDDTERRRRILVVDDEELLRNALARMLALLGYDVVAVRSGKEAIEYYRLHGHETDLVILDSVMPVMNGRECFRILKELDPEVRVLISTATSFSRIDPTGQYAGVAGFIRKPYGMTRLSEAVARSMTVEGSQC